MNCILLAGQVDTVTIGFEGQVPVTVTSSSGTSAAQATMTTSGFLMNEAAASRFLSHACTGYGIDDITDITLVGKEDWLDMQLNMPIQYELLPKVRDYYTTIVDSTGNNNYRVSSRAFRYALWNQLMTASDYVRQRVALALSEVLVVSEFSSFSNNGFALASYYDVLYNNALGNYKDILMDVTYSPAMGVYLTYMNNPKTNLALNQFPDENYAREVMQLFSIGTQMLNNDGTVQVDSVGQPIATYDNDDILEYSKIFTGLTWADRTNFGSGNRNDTSYIPPMQMYNSQHEPGPKYLLNGQVVPDRNPVDGDADIADAIEGLFMHPNTAPFICKLLIQRLVTSNPSPDYVLRVVEVFLDDGNGTRGNLKEVVRAILLDEEATSCQNRDNIYYGMLREPFIRYVQLHKALNASTSSGIYRNDMDYIYQYTGQRPLRSPSVFNFFQADYQPIGPIEDADLVAPEFQITDAQTITGYFNGLDRWIIDENIADEYDIFGNEVNTGYDDEITTYDISDLEQLTDDDQLHILFDKLNLLFAHGDVSIENIEVLKGVVMQFPNSTASEKRLRAKLSIYLFLTSPQYLIKK